MYTCCDIDNPFKTREGERIVDLNKFVESLKENNIYFSKEQYEKANKHLDYSRCLLLYLFI